MQRVGVQFLVGELRSEVKKKKKTEWNWLESPSHLWWVISSLWDFGGWFSFSQTSLLTFCNLSPCLVVLFSMAALYQTPSQFLYYPKGSLKALWVMVTQQCTAAGNLKFDTSPFWMILCLFHLWTFFTSSFGLGWQLPVMILGPSLSFALYPSFPIPVNFLCRPRLAVSLSGFFSFRFCRFSSAQFSRSVMSDSLWPHESEHARPPYPSPTPGVHSDSCPSSQWCHPAISSSVVTFSSCPQPLPASESFPMSQLFTWGGQSTGVSASASFLPKKSQGWSPSEWTGWISLQSKGFSRVVFMNLTLV